MPSRRGEVTAWLKRLNEGHPQAQEKLAPMVIDELRRLARHYMANERVGHTLQPTALVNEAYLRMAGYQNLNWKGRSHFIGVAAAVMRQVLIDYARKRLAMKRGGDQEEVPLDDDWESLSVEQSEELLDLHSALQRLEKMNPRHSKIVELKYFGGLSIDEIAEVLGVSSITVKRDWTVVRSWLRAELKGLRESSSEPRNAN
jgi:RNA polymerase sigma factor (TIGR02999 family)